MGYKIAMIYLMLHDLFCLIKIRIIEKQLHEFFMKKLNKIIFLVSVILIEMRRGLQPICK